ncbi:MAG TPA: energy transducer TonB, partial [Candidatus Krumholzibacteria bacterium]|nr:energy transducer TonB [Candidatus Krumholzibacteria bacterium]
ARESGWEGSVVAEVVVNADGTVCSATIAESSGREDVDFAVLDSAEHWLYEPGTFQGEAVRTEIRQVVNFLLSK